MGGDFKTIIHVYYQYVIFLLNDNKSISGQHKKVVVIIRLYRYMYTNTINKEKGNVIICKQKVKKQKWDNSVERALVISTINLAQGIM
jgi:hypothetical protein